MALSTDEQALAQLLSEVCRRALDGAGLLNLSIQISATNNDFKINTPGFGFVLPVGNTGNFGRVTLDSNYALDVVPLQPCE